MGSPHASGEEAFIIPVTLQHTGMGVGVGVCVCVAVYLNLRNLCVLTPPARKIMISPAFSAQTPSRLRQGC